MRRTSLPNPNAGADGTVLADGRALLVYNHTRNGRSPLNVSVSSNGKEWEGALVLENHDSRAPVRPPIPCRWTRPKHSAASARCACGCKRAVPGRRPTRCHPPRRLGSAMTFGACGSTCRRCWYSSSRSGVRTWSVKSPEWSRPDIAAGSAGWPHDREEN